MKTTRALAAELLLTKLQLCTCIAAHVCLVVLNYIKTLRPLRPMDSHQIDSKELSCEVVRKLVRSGGCKVCGSLEEASHRDPAAGLWYCRVCFRDVRPDLVAMAKGGVFTTDCWYCGYDHVAGCFHASVPWLETTSCRSIRHSAASKGGISSHGEDAYVSWNAFVDAQQC